MMDTTYNTFDTLCLTWRDQLKTPLEGPRIKKENDTVDILLSNLLEDIWMQCERLFKQSEMPAANMKFTTDNFCLHVMNQLISTHNQLYDIRRRKIQEKLAQASSEKVHRMTNVVPCTDKNLSIHELLDICTNNQSILEHEKNSRQRMRSSIYSCQSDSKCLDENGTKEEKYENPEEGSSKIEITNSPPTQGHRVALLRPVKYKSKKALPFLLDERNARFSLRRLLPKSNRSHVKKGFALG